MSSVHEIKTWWGTHVNQKPIWLISDLPQPFFKDILVSLKLGYEIRKGLIALGKPDTEAPVLIHSYFWEIVSCILKPLSPYAITGIAAIQHYLGNESIPLKLDILTKNSNARIALDNVSTLRLEKNPELFKGENQYVKTIQTKKEYPLSIETPESLLIRLRLQFFREYPQLVSGFLKTTDFDIEKLSELILEQNRPVIYLRLAALFEQLGKNTEAILFKNITKSNMDYSAPGKGQIVKYSFPASITSPKLKSDPAYVTRFRDQLRYYSELINSILKSNHASWNLKKILTYAEKTKKYDTYHSSTIEGYRVTESEIQLLIEGKTTSSQSNNREDIERKMALKGYLEAHHFTLKMIEEHFKLRTPLTEQTIREIYANLFSPTVEAGFLKKEQLIRYRNEAVYIRDSRFVPPNYTKVEDLMRCLVEEINIIENPVTQAIIAHYGFVTVHPYFDGNGRVARLLMNYMLCRSGIPWITIRIEDRDTYFSALEKAQCDEDIEPLIQFLKKYLEEGQIF